MFKKGIPGCYREEKTQSYSFLNRPNLTILGGFLTGVGIFIETSPVQDIIKYFGRNNESRVSIFSTFLSDRGHCNNQM